jgi:hypothetical protein
VVYIRHISAVYCDRHGELLALSPRSRRASWGLGCLRFSVAGASDIRHTTFAG